MKKTKSTHSKTSARKSAVKKSVVKKATKKTKAVSQTVAKKKTPKKSPRASAQAIAKRSSKKTTAPAKRLIPKATSEPLSHINATYRTVEGPNTIFVQIASYRDPELVPTIRDCILKAKYPENLRFGICRQFHELDEFDNLDEFRGDSRFRILDVVWYETLGLCWARSKIQDLYDGEKYTLQLDSHHRFIQDWDDVLVNMIEKIDSPKPLITAYCAAYDPLQTDQDWSHGALKMRPEHFTSYGTIVFRPEYIENFEHLDHPIPARFVSGHFFFTVGAHCQEYKYDPNIYFLGDEISLSIRSYTLGYDLYHPHRSIIAHNYRSYVRPMHWDDHLKSKNAQISSDWYETNENGLKRLRQMLREEDNGIDLGPFDLGNVRSHSDYEAYAGLDFFRKKIHPFALLGFDPPTTGDQNWGRYKATYQIELDWSDAIANILIENIAYLYIGFDGPNGVIYSEYVSDPSILIGEITKKKFSFLYHELPIKAVFFGVTHDNLWSQRIEKSL